MATLTIRNLEDPLKRRLRLRAAARNRSMEEEARQILRAALMEAAAPEADLGSRIRSRFAKVGDVELPIAPREAVRTPPVLSVSHPGTGTSKRPAASRGLRRR
jgi:antitoxin FitA